MTSYKGLGPQNRLDQSDKSSPNHAADNLLNDYAIDMTTVAKPVI